MTRDMYNIFNAKDKKKDFCIKTFTFKFCIQFHCEQSHGPSHDLIRSLKLLSEMVYFMPIGREFHSDCVLKQFGNLFHKHSTWYANDLMPKFMV